MQDKATFTSSMIEGFLFVRDWVLHATHAVSDLRSNLAGRLVLPALSDKVLRLREAAEEVGEAGVPPAPAP